MSNYTTEVRYICESIVGLSVSGDYNSVEDTIAKASPLIFNFQYPIFDESYRQVLQTKILKHFYTREIGFETVGLWKLKLNTKMNEIMPFYNQLYKSELLSFNPFDDVDLTIKREITKDSSKDSDVVTNEKSNTTQTVNSVVDVINSGSDKTVTRYSDTPQGSLENIENNTYLTNVTINDGTDERTGKTENTGNSSGEITGETKTVNISNINDIEDYLEKITGKRGGENYSDLLNKFRSTFLNIDLLVIDELEELFMQLW